MPNVIDAIKAQLSENEVQPAADSGQPDPSDQPHDPAVAALRELLPNTATLAMVCEELTILPAEIDKLHETGLLVESESVYVPGISLPNDHWKMPGGYTGESIARAIVASDLDWERTQLSRDRQRYSVEELIEPKTLYPTRFIFAELQIDQEVLRDALDIETRDVAAAYILGGVLGPVLASLQSRGLRVFIPAGTVQSAVVTLREREREAAGPEETDVQYAIRRQREHQERIDSDRRFKMLCEYGDLVRRDGTHSETQIERLGELLLLLGFNETRYNADVQAISHMDFLETINCPEEIENSIQAQKDSREEWKILQKLELTLPEKINTARVAFMRAAANVRDVANAPKEIEALRTEKSYLFIDSEVAESAPEPSEPSILDQLSQ